MQAAHRKATIVADTALSQLSMVDAIVIALPVSLIVGSCLALSRKEGEELHITALE